MTNEGQNSVNEKWTKEHSYYNPVNVQDTLGVIILGALSFILLVALLRSEARNRKLLAQLSQSSQ